MLPASGKRHLLFATARSRAGSDQESDAQKRWIRLQASSRDCVEAA
jgi:hypothetical protein